MIEVGSMVGGYEITRELSRGGMATLFLAKRSGPAGFSRHVAIKVIRKELAADEHFREMFLDEARLSARVHHPNVVHVEALGEHEGEFYLVLEYIEGVTVADVLRGMARRRRHVPIHLTVAMVATVADGLHAAHEATDPSGEPLNLVHRDVSPQNILISARGHIKVIDFGVAKARGRLTQTEAGELKGKLAYMTPEQVRGLSIDRRSDVFSLGTVLWEMLTMRRLFYSDREAQIITAIREAKIPPPSSHREDLHPDLDHVVLTALAGEPEHRFQTAFALRRALLSVSPQSGLVDAAELASLVEEVASPELDRRRSVVVELEDETTETTVVSPMSSAVLFAAPTEQLGKPSSGAAIQEHDATVAAARRMGETLPLVRALSVLVAALLDASQLERADAALAECASLVRQEGPGVRAHIAALQARLARAHGELGERRDAEEQAYHLYKDAAWSRRAVQAGLVLAQTRRVLGTAPESEALIRDAIATGTQLGMTESLGDAWIALGQTLVARGAWPEAEGAFGEALLRGDQGGEPAQEAAARAHRSLLLTTQHRFDDALAEAEEALRIALAHPALSRVGAPSRVTDWAHAAIASAALGLGDFDKALDHSGKSLRWLSSRTYLEDADASLLRTRVRVLEGCGQTDGASALRSTAAARLRTMAATIGDAATAERYLSGVRDHAALLEGE